MPPDKMPAYRPLPPGVEILPPPGSAGSHTENPERVQDESAPRGPWFEVALWALLLVLYVGSPLDLIPDFIPILGQLDDLLVGGGLLGLMARAVLRYFRLRAWRRLTRKAAPARRGAVRSILARLFTRGVTRTK